jgi:hypothetical protein
VSTGLSSRRGLLSAAGFAAAGVVAGGGGVHLLSGGRASGATEMRGSPGDRRRAQALKVRTDAARRQLGHQTPERRSNGDEDRNPPGLASFTKTLPHNRLGEVDPDAYRALLLALDSGRQEDFEQVPMAGRVRLGNPQAAFAFGLEGSDGWAQPMQSPPALSSESFAGEMAERYWLALARDVPYARGTSAGAGTSPSGRTATSPTEVPWSPRSSCSTTPRSTARRY